MTAAVLAATALLALVGCATGEPMPTPPAPSTSASASAPATTEPEPAPVVDAVPEFLPGGTALANKDVFDHTNQTLLSNQPGAKGKDIIDALAATGFDKSAMQVTYDTTPTSRSVEAIEFSVRAHDDCLIGQWGHAVYSSVIAPVLANGSCLIGKTRPIDW